MKSAIQRCIRSLILLAGHIQKVPLPLYSTSCLIHEEWDMWNGKIPGSSTEFRLRVWDEHLNHQSYRLPEAN